MLIIYSTLLLGMLRIILMYFFNPVHLLAPFSLVHNCTLYMNLQYMVIYFNVTDTRSLFSLLSLKLLLTALEVGLI